MNFPKKEICVEYKPRENGYQVLVHFHGKVLEGGFLNKLPFSIEELSNPSRILEKEKSTQ